MSKKELEYENKLNKSLEAQAKYYDDHDISDFGDLSKMTVRSEKLKKIYIGIPQPLYKEAMGLSELSGTGYQNILKMAMRIGINELSDKLKH